MMDRDQFIVWTEIPDTPKARKVPWSVAEMGPCDPHDPKYWMSYADATEQATNGENLHVGFVLTAGDPYFLIDLDSCRDPLTGQWTQAAMQVAGMFPNAAMEISHNQTGMHIMGCCNPLVIGSTRHKFKWHDLEIEFYHDKRFVALGHGLQGDINLDWTTVLSTFVPKAEQITTVDLVDSACQEYTGPEDDDQLIELMLNSRGSADQVFGNKATIKQLWDCDQEALGKVFPSAKSDAFDRSSADAALMSHLAFFTGKNTARMDRLFRRSGLMRDKYEKRDDYRVNTISGAVSGCKMVYNKPRQEIIQVQHAESGPDQMRIDTFPEILNVHDQVEYFRGCVYVVHSHSVVIPGGVELKPAQFKSFFGGHQFLLSSEMSGKLCTNAFEAFTENRVARFPKVQHTTFRPDRTPGEIIGNAVNVYYPEDIPTKEGDVQPFMDLLQKLLPVADDREIVLAYMASLVQNQGKKFLWTVVLQGVEGNGKSMIGEFLLYCVGDKYSWTPKADKINAQFNGFLQNRVLINVEEMNMFHKLEMLETLKDYITGNRQEVERKGIDSIMIRDYCANWFFCTNHKDAIIKTRNDRRFSIFFTAQQTIEDLARDGMVGDYFPNLWDWARGGGFAAVRHFLLNYQIPKHLDPAGACTRAPITSSTDAAIESSYGFVEQLILEAVDEERQGFKGGWISSWHVNKLMTENGKKIPPKKVGMFLEKLGYSNTGRSTSQLLLEGNSRPSLWCDQSAKEPYEQAQGYAVGTPGQSMDTTKVVH